MFNPERDSRIVPDAERSSNMDIVKQWTSQARQTLCTQTTVSPEFEDKRPAKRPESAGRAVLFCTVGLHGESHLCRMTCGFRCDSIKKRIQEQRAVKLALQSFGRFPIKKPIRFLLGAGNMHWSADTNVAQLTEPTRLQGRGATKKVKGRTWLWKVYRM